MIKLSIRRKALAACLLFMLCCATSAKADGFESARDAVKNMGVGWCLGNALDAYSQTYHDPAETNYWGQQGLTSETCWGQPVTKPELITMMKNAGFGAIRVPVTWFNHMDADGKVSAEWMARVHEVVDYVIDAGLYCIINVHHDTGADDDNFVSWLKADDDNYTKNKDRYEYLWKQIAEEFKDYDQHLIFEGYNEMLDKLSSWCYASFKATNQYDASVATSAYNAINNYAQSFVNAVRATGGNNSQRNLIVNTYASCCGQGTWSSYLKDPLKNMKLPTDNTEGHIAFQVHDYPNIEGDMTSVKSELDNMFTALTSNLISKGPVIIGEWGTSNVDKTQTDYDLRRDKMFEFVDYFIAKAKTYNIATFYWAGLSNTVYRSIPAFNQPDLAERIVKAYHGSEFEGEFPTMGNVDCITLFEGQNDMEWGQNNISLDAALFNDDNKDKVIQITYKQNYTDYDVIQFCYGDWSSPKPTVTVDSKSYTGDFGPYNHYKTLTGTEHVTAFKLTDASYTNAATKKGIIIQGHGVQITKVVMVSASSTAIHTPQVSSGALSKQPAVYNLQGQKVSAPAHPGVYIINGKKYSY